MKVSIELPVATRHRPDMTEKLLKAMLNLNTHTHHTNTHTQTHTHTFQECYLFILYHVHVRIKIIFLFCDVSLIIVWLRCHELIFRNTMR